MLCLNELKSLFKPDVNTLDFSVTCVLARSFQLKNAFRALSVDLDTERHFAQKTLALHKKLHSFEIKGGFIVP